MMPIQIIIFLSFIQGSAEFLPISSAGHVLLIEHWLRLPYNILTFDIALNVGTLLTTVVYFRKDIIYMLVEVKNLLTLKVTNYRELVILKIFVSTIPVVIIGYLIVYFSVLENLRNNHTLLAVNLIIFGIILYLVDIFNNQNINFSNITIKQAFVIGIIQCIALMPGVSRSGSTITAARLQKIKRVDAVKFSFLISMPATFGAVVLTTLSTIKCGITIEGMIDILLGITFSFIFGLIFIHFLLRFVSIYSFKIFAIYRILLGILILLFI